MEFVRCHLVEEMRFPNDRIGWMHFLMYVAVISKSARRLQLTIKMSMIVMPQTRRPSVVIRYYIWCVQGEYSCLMIWAKRKYLMEANLGER